VITEGLSVSPADVRKFFERIPVDSLPFFSAEVTVGQIVKKPDVSEAEKERVFELLSSIKQQILDGETDFATMARKYSEDPGSAMSGGDLGFFNRGGLAREYEPPPLGRKPGEFSVQAERMSAVHVIRWFGTRGIVFK